MIIWGSTGKTKRIDSLRFFCPKCLEYTEGDHLRLSRYFTLYFIPLFPIETLGEYVRCEECDREFDASVLELTKEDYEAATRPWKCSGCGNSNPSEYKKCLSCGGTRGSADDDARPARRTKPSPAAGMKECPYCGEQIKAVATLCRFCRESLDD